MNYRLLCRLLSVIVGSIGLAFVLSLGVGQWIGRPEQKEAALSGWLICITVAFALAGVFLLFSRGASRKMFRKEALAVIGLGWLIASLLGALPYYLLIEDCTIPDAIFEATSGITTTGASVFPSPDSMPRSLQFWRCLSQWIGGLGIVVFFVAVLAFLGAGAKILYSNEASAASTQIDSPRIQSGILQILALYIVLSVACAGLYVLFGMSVYDAICHMFTTVATGGFSNYAASFSRFNPALQWTAIVFMILGGTSFIVLLRAWQRDWRNIYRSTEVRFYFAAILTFTVIIAFVLFVYQGEEAIEPTIRMAMFQTVSVMTSTGYSSADFDQWVNATHVFLLLMMVVGGCSGSTAGGLKVARAIVALKSSLLSIEQAFRPHVVRTLKMDRRVLGKEDRDAITTYIVIAVIIALVSIGIIALLEPRLAYEDNVSAVISCLFNVGPGFGEVGPTQTYHFFSAPAKLHLSLLMILGRLEFFAILVLFAPSLWRRFS